MDRHRFHHHHCQGQAGQFQYRNRPRNFPYQFRSNQEGHLHHRPSLQLDLALVGRLHRNLLADRLVVHRHRNQRDSAS